jgi:aspartate/methionine/tyrosine aminotransferase
MATQVVPSQEALPRARFQSDRTRDFTESVIREMTRLAIRYGAVNLAQGFPDFGAPPQIKAPASAAITADINQYSITWGSKPLREAIAAKYRRSYAFEADLLEAKLASVLGQAVLPTLAFLVVNHLSR